MDSVLLQNFEAIIGPFYVCSFYILDHNMKVIQPHLLFYLKQIVDTALVDSKYVLQALNIPLNTMVINLNGWILIFYL